jgi:hypothetical protein
MRRRYGEPFAAEFRRHADGGTADFDAQGWHADLRSPDYFIQLGYRVAARASYQVWLVHPTGRWRYVWSGVPMTTHPPCDENEVEAIKSWAQDAEERQKDTEAKREELRKMLQQTDRSDPDYQALFEEYEDDIKALEKDVATLSSEATSFAKSNPNCAQYSDVINDAVTRMTEVGFWIDAEKMPWPAGWLENLRPSKADFKRIPDHIRKRVPGLPTNPGSP